MTPEKRETAIKWLQNEIRSLRLAPTINGCGPENWADLLEIMETCLEAVRGHGSEPIAIEQLREMGGQPYWHVGLQTDSPEAHWKILDLFVARCPEDYGYGKRWLAYAYPPAHIDREAWTAEWRELHGDKMVGLDDCGEDVYRHYHYSVCTSCGKGTAVKSNFCPSCGRAMTPEAWAELEKRLRGW